MPVGRYKEEQPVNWTREIIISRAFLLGGFFILFSSCGYSMSGQTTGLPEEIRTIAIPIFENKSTEPDIEIPLTRATIEEFTKDGRLKVVPVKRADAVLTGTIQSYTLEPISFDSNFNVSSYRSWVSISLEIKDRLGLGVNYSIGIRNQVTYNVSAPLQKMESSRLEALNTLGKDVGEKIVGTLLERF